MKTESYTPGHSTNATDFMSKRSLASHGAFFDRHLRAGMRVLDCGCGPGSITLGIARRVAPAETVGVDFSESQIIRAKKDALERAVANVRFLNAGCYSLPFENETFDCVFSHALFEHLSDPTKALAEFHRVLKPGGHAGICSPDWGGFIMSPPSAAVTEAIAAYTALQTRNGGDVYVGRKLSLYLAESGFSSIEVSARYECHPALSSICEYLALQLKQSEYAQHSAALVEWSKSGGGLFAQAWISAIGKK
jgi:ubiquinone/menaquinone biosynthesis C-methylase UbiE